MYFSEPNNGNEISCLKCTKRKNSLLSDLSTDELKILDKNRHTASFKPGEIICREGTKPLGLICLNTGKVKMVITGVNGVEQIVGLKKSVDFIGFRTLMGGNTYLSSYVALENSSVCIIKKADFFKVLERNNTLAFKIIQSFASDLIKSDTRLVNLTQKHIRSRLAEALLLINDIYGTNPRTGILNVLLKRSDLAGIANMTTANAIRILSSLSKEQLIDVNHRNIKINNLKVLKEISTLDR